MDPGHKVLKCERYSKYHRMYFKDIFASLLFCVHSSGVRRLVDNLDPENQPGKDRIGSGDLGGIKRTSDTKSMERTRTT